MPTMEAQSAHECLDTSVKGVIQDAQVLGSQVNRRFVIHNLVKIQATRIGLPAKQRLSAAEVDGCVSAVLETLPNEAVPLQDVHDLVRQQVDAAMAYRRDGCR